MLRLYGSPITRAQRVMWMLEELGVKYEQIPAVLPSKLGPVLAKEELEKLNPSGKVPVLVDGETVLSESLGINLYLAMQYPSELTPSSPAAWGSAYQWTCWILNDVDRDLTRVLGVRRGGALAKLTPAQLEEDRLYRWAVQYNLGKIESRLESAEWLIDDHFTVADLNVAAVLALAEPSGIGFEPLPRTKRWLSTCLARPASRTAWGKVRADATAFGFVGDLQLGGR